MLNLESEVVKVRARPCGRQERPMRTRWHDSMPNFLLKIKGFKRSVKHISHNSFLIFMGSNSKFHSFHSAFNHLFLFLFTGLDFMDDMIKLN